MSVEVLHTGGPLHFGAEGWLLGLLVLPLIVVFLLLRAPIQRIAVAHLPFLERALGRRARSTPPWRRLLELLCVLIAWSGACLWLADPFREREVPLDRDLVIVIDDSLASRARHTRGGQLLDRLRARAVALAEGRGRPPLILGVGGGLHRIDGTAVDSTLGAAVAERLTVGRGVADWEAALEVARRRSAEADVVFLTGERPSAELRSRSLPLGVWWDLVEAPALGAGVKLLAASGSGTLRVEVAGAGPPRELIVAHAGREVFRGSWDPSARDALVQEVELPQDVQREGGPISVRLAPGDAFEEDDRAVLTWPAAPGRDVIVGPGVGREAVLAWARASDRVSAIREISSWTEEVLIARGDAVRVVFGERFDRPVGPGVWWCFGASAPNLPWALDSAEPEPGEVVRVARDRALLRGLDLDAWVVSRARRMVPAEGFEALVAGARGPLLGTFERGAVRGLAAATTPAPSDGSLGLLPAFPILLDALLEEQLPGGAEEPPAVLRAGSWIPARAPGPVVGTDASGMRWPLEVSADGTRWRLPEIAGRLLIEGDGWSDAVDLAWLDHPGAPSSPARAEPAGFSKRRGVERLSGRELLLVVLASSLGVWWCLGLLGRE